MSMMPEACQRPEARMAADQSGALATQGNVMSGACQDAVHPIEHGGRLITAVCMSNIASNRNLA